MDAVTKRYDQANDTHTVTIVIGTEPMANSIEMHFSGGWDF